MEVNRGLPFLQSTAFVFVLVSVSMSPSVAELQAATVDHVQAVKENIKEQEAAKTAEVVDKVGGAYL